MHVDSYNSKIEKILSNMEKESLKKGIQVGLDLLTFEEKLKEENKNFSYINLKNKFSSRFSILCLP